MLLASTDAVNLESGFRFRGPLKAAYMAGWQARALEPQAPVQMPPITINVPLPEELKVAVRNEPRSMTLVHDELGRVVGMKTA